MVPNMGAKPKPKTAAQKYAFLRRAGEVQVKKDHVTVLRRMAEAEGLALSSKTVHDAGWVTTTVRLHDDRGNIRRPGDDLRG
jgi:hypothetical protein